jgi:amidohydrolase
MSRPAVEFSQAELAELVANRRWLHQHPELKFEEVESAKFIAERMRAYGYEISTGIATTGVAATLKTDKPGPTILLRADMDALPILEENNVEYSSQRAGVMHACGHDGHMAALLGAARQLIQKRDSMRGNLKIVFQPGEEGGNGALKMIEEGILEAPRVDACFGLHLWNGLPVGKVGVVAGPIMASVDEFIVTIKGRGGHAAMPHQTVDAVLAASHVVCALQSVVARNVNPLDSAVITVGSFHAGSAFNVIADSAKLLGTVRTFSRQLYDEIPHLFERVVKGAAAAMGAECEIEYLRQCMPTINNQEMTEFVRGVAAEVVGAENIVTDDSARTMGGEDMSFFLDRVPGCFFFVGSQNCARALAHPHHSPKFDFDEGALPIGAEILKRIACQFLK